MIDISRFGKGAIPQPIKLRDFRLELTATATPLPQYFSLREKVGKIKNQNGSGSCVGQAFAYYAEVLNYIETEKKTELSARDLYSQNFVEPMGAFLKDVASQTTHTGIVLEADAVSYENGNPPSESFMRKRDDITKEEIENGKTFLTEKYLTFSPTVEQFKRAIYDGNGSVSAFAGNNYCWNDAKVKVMDNIQQANWYHAVYLIGFNDTTKEFEFVNSWGEEWGDNGFGWLPYEYIEKGYATNPHVLKDIPNETYVKLMSQIKNLMELIVKILKEKLGIK